MSSKIWPAVCQLLLLMCLLCHNLCVVWVCMNNFVSVEYKKDQVIQHSVCLSLSKTEKIITGVTVIIEYRIIKLSTRLVTE